jgi:hypothetical protein
MTLLDTAGIRDSDDPVEQEGVRRARRRAAEADLVLWVEDARRVAELSADAGAAMAAVHAAAFAAGPAAGRDAGANAKPRAAAQSAASSDGKSALPSVSPQPPAMPRESPAPPTTGAAIRPPSPAQTGSLAEPSVSRRPDSPSAPGFPSSSGLSHRPAGLVGVASPSHAAAQLGLGSPPNWLILNKIDLCNMPEGPRIKNESEFALSFMYFAISATTGEGMDPLLDALARHAEAFFGSEPALVTRERQRQALSTALSALERARAEGAQGREDIIAEELRLAAVALGRLLGRVDVEDVLDTIFRDFCIGK